MLLVVQLSALLSNRAFRSVLNFYTLTTMTNDMTNETAELRALIAEGVLELQTQLAAYQKAAEERQKEYQKAAEERQKAAEERRKEYEERQKQLREEYEQRRAEADRTMEELKRQTKEIGKQLGGLGNKFGSFTEGLLLPSVERMLHERFGVTDFAMRLKSYHGEAMQELDGFGFVNGEKNIGFIVEVKSHLDQRSIDQTLEEMQRFGQFHPHFKGMRLFGILAAVDTVSEEQRRAVYNAGLYLVTVDDDVAEMPEPPSKFAPASVVV